MSKIHETSTVLVIQKLRLGAGLDIQPQGKTHQPQGKRQMAGQIHLPPSTGSLHEICISGLHL